jgi:septal ring-binding cell division protein DamX
MGRLSASLLALAVAAAVALGLSACGSGGADLLPGKTAGEINSNLDKVQELVGEGECVGAENAAQEVSAEIDALGGVDKKLKQALREGATRLKEVVESCQEASSEETEPALETAVESEAEPEKQKPVKPEKPKPKQEVEEPEEAETTPTLPPQAKGKAKGHENPEEEAASPVEGGGTPSGGVGPSAAVEGE